MDEIKTFDEKLGVGILSGKPPTKPQGPRRRPPAYYAGETYGGRNRLSPKANSRPFSNSVRKGPGRPMNYPDVERYPNGALPATRNKHMRRLIRKAFKRHHSTVEKALKLPRAMMAQARLIAKENGKSSRWARRLFERELAIHMPLPNEPTRAQRREYAKRLKKEGKKDAISQLVDKMSSGVKL